MPEKVRVDDVERRRGATGQPRRERGPRCHIRLLREDQQVLPVPRLHPCIVPDSAAQNVEAGEAPFREARTPLARPGLVHVALALLDVAEGSACLQMKSEY